MSLEKAKEITEDDRFQALKDLDVLTKEYNDKIKLISDEKEKEVMTI
jgi:ribosome recycling factor